MNVQQVNLELNKIKLIEYSDPTYTYDDRVFLQSGIAGFYVNKEDLRDLASIINYYLNAESYAEMRVKVGENYVAT